VDACHALVNRTQWNLAHGRVTVSTVGLVSQIRKLTQELPEINLALSLHAPSQGKREAIVPTANRYPIESLIQALDEHMMAYLHKRKKREAAKSGNTTDTNMTTLSEYTAAERMKESTRRRAMIEYVMLEGDTSSIESAHQLGKLCENRHLVVNLIPYNQTDVKDKLKCPSWDHMQKFREIVASYGAFCTIRRTMGADIDSACGQLITLKQKQEEEEQEREKHAALKVPVRDIEDAVPTPSAANTNSTKAKTTSIGSARDLTPPADSTNDVVSNGHKENAASNDALDRWILPLSVATSVSAACFLAASTLYLKQSRRR